jgi:hypothetical protein
MRSETGASGWPRSENARNAAFMDDPPFCAWAIGATLGPVRFRSASFCREIVSSDLVIGVPAWGDPWIRNNRPHDLDRAMPAKSIELPPAVARAFVRDMKAGAVTLTIAFDCR